MSGSFHFSFFVFCHFDQKMKQSAVIFRQTEDFLILGHFDQNEKWNEPDTIFFNLSKSQVCKHNISWSYLLFQTEFKPDYDKNSRKFWNGRIPILSASTTQQEFQPKKVQKHKKSTIASAPFTFWISQHYFG